MTKKITYQMIYDAPLERVTAMLADPGFRREVCEFQGFTEVEVDLEARGDGMEVTIDQWQATEGVPSIAKKIVGDKTNVVQHEVWSSPTAADLDITIPGKPGQMVGTVSIIEEGEKTIETVDLNVTVKIPLIAGKLEDVIAGLLLKALKAENKVGRDYLAR